MPVSPISWSGSSWTMSLLRFDSARHLQEQGSEDGAGDGSVESLALEQQQLF
jgi:hypothetical protein